MHTKIWCAVAVLAAIVAATSGRGPAHGQSQTGTSFLVRDVRVFDGERVHENTQVAVEAGIIRAVGRDLTMWRHLPVIDGTGATLMPGLIDAHVHVRDGDELRQALRFGVTTAFDLGATMEPDALFALRAAANAAPTWRISVLPVSSRTRLALQVHCSAHPLHQYPPLKMPGSSSRCAAPKA